MESDKMADEAHLALQHNLNSWGQLLIASERALKPEKIFFYPIIQWDREGQWQYCQNHLEDKFEVTVPLPYGETAPIKHILTDETRITLSMASFSSARVDLELSRVKDRAASSALGKMQQYVMI